MAGGSAGAPTDALAGYHFAIEIDGITIAQFQEVSGIASELDVIELKQNTSDGKYVIHKLPGNRKPPTITLKRGNDSSMDVWQWHQKIYEGNVVERPQERLDRALRLQQDEVGRYNFVNAWPSKVSVGLAQSGRNEVLMEEVTMVCEEVERVK